MKAAGSGTLIFIGATASRRGGPNTAAFAPAKAAQRSLAESMARSLWPAGIHVALIVVDAVVDLPRTRRSMPGKPDDFFLKPDDIGLRTQGLPDLLSEQSPLAGPLRRGGDGRGSPT